MTQRSSPVSTLAPADGLIHTRFGEFRVNSPAIVTFPNGILGFENCHRFVLISSEELSPLRCLHSLDAPCPSFLAANPLAIRAGYTTRLAPVDRFRLGVRSGDPLVWLTILSVGPRRVTANLAAPVVINARQMIGRQVIIDDATYPVCVPVSM